MANKPKKKRSKQYRGADAALTRPVVTKIQAEDRSKPKQWWHDHKRIAKPALITSAVVLFVVWLIMQIAYFAGH